MPWWDRPWPGPYPGRGPWSHLPPWLRPGWWWPGWCWRYWHYAYPYAPPTAEAELKYLEDLKKYIHDVVLKDIDARIEELKKGLKKGPSE